MTMQRPMGSEEQKEGQPLLYGPTGETLFEEKRGQFEREREVGAVPPGIKEAEEREIATTLGIALDLAKSLGPSWMDRLVRDTEIMQDVVSLQGFIDEAKEELSKREEAKREKEEAVERRAEAAGERAWSEEERREARETREKAKEAREAEERRKRARPTARPTPTYIRPTPLPAPVRMAGTYPTGTGLQRRTQIDTDIREKSKQFMASMPLSRVSPLFSRQPTLGPTRQPTVWPTEQPTRQLQEIPVEVELGPGEQIEEQVQYPVWIWVGPKRRWEQAASAYIVSMDTDKFRFAAVDRLGTPRSKTIGLDVSRAPEIASKRGGN